MYRNLIFLSLFWIGYSSVLPVIDARLGLALPWFIDPDTYSLGKVRVYELIMALISVHPTGRRSILSFFSSSLNSKTPFKQGCTLLLVLALLCQISTLFSAFTFYSIQISDFFEPLRLVLFAIYSICLQQFCYASSAEYAIVSYLLGFLVSGVTHLVFAPELTNIRIGLFSGLIGQNGPGPGFAIASLFSALLLVVHTSRGIKVIFPYLAFAVSAYGALFSFSKNSNLIFFAGAIAFSAVLAKHFSSSLFARRKLLVAVLAGIATVVTILKFEIVLGAFKVISDGISAFYDAKFGDLGYLVNSESTTVRASYFSYTIQAALESPLGWGAGNFYEAMKAVSFPFLFDEPIDGTGNPHNSWLYYLYIAGFLGFFAAIASAAFFLRYMWRAFRSIPIAFIAMCSAWIIYSMALPSFYTTPYFLVFIVLAASCRDQAVLSVNT